MNPQVYLQVHTMTEKNTDFNELALSIKQWARELGFADAGICATDLNADEPFLLNYLNAGYHGEMDYMAKHGTLRSRPAELVPGTLRVISLRMPYLPASPRMRECLDQRETAYISRYALGRDYHKLMRKRLQMLADRILQSADSTACRVFVDSAPVLETALARNAGLGWKGKHTLLLKRNAGSYFFLGEIFVNLPLPLDPPVEHGHCGTCTSCLTSCPTQAFAGPYVLDARRCISYLTIELKGNIPLELRPLMGNRIFGCDDCQLACPWNRFSETTAEDDFTPRHQLDNSSLVELFGWTEDQFLLRTQGSPIRRTGYESWLRNLAVAMGNATPGNIPVIEALKARRDYPSDIVREHIHWALEQHGIYERP